MAMEEIPDGSFVVGDGFDVDELASEGENVHGRNLTFPDWWGLLAAFLLVDFLFLLIPIRQGPSLRRLSAAGRGWAAAAWLLVIFFLWVVVPTNAIGLRRQHPILVTSAGLLFLAALVVAIWKVSSSWVRESLRSIVARTG